MLRLPGKVLAALALATLAAHAALVVPALRFQDGDLPGLGLLVVLLLVLGRVALACLPPGSIGSHSWSGLPVTLAASFALGFVIHDLFWSRTSWGEGIGTWILFLVLVSIRWITLPGAMVPRHATRSRPITTSELLWIASCAIWCVCLGFSESPVDAWGWFALSILLFDALGVAHRDRLGRFWILGLSALVAASLELAALGRAGVAFAPALSVGAGGAFSIAWVRRADKRAGALAAIFFASALAESFDPLALAGIAALLVASRRPQRAFALRTSVCAALVFALPPWLAHDSFHRGRWLRPRELLARALDWQEWGLAWPLVALALVIGVASFRWREEPWTSGTVEEPRREVHALALLIALAALALALPISPWSEPEALVILFPPLVLLAGLLALPAERPSPTPSPAPARVLAGAGTRPDR